LQFFIVMILLKKMVRRNFKFFDTNDVPPYNQYVVGNYEPNNGGYIRNRTWHWTQTPIIHRAEPDGFVREHVADYYIDTTINDFLRRYDYYEVYIYMIVKQTENNRIRLFAPSTTNNRDIRDIVDFDNDIVKILAILI